MPFLPEAGSLLVALSRTDQARRRDVKFISASEPEYVLSPQECRHSTLYGKARGTGETVFSETFEYTSWNGIICVRKMFCLMIRLSLFIKSIPPSGNTSSSLRGCVSWLPIDKLKPIPF